MVGTRYLVLLLIGLAGASYMLRVERRQRQGPQVEANIPQSDRCRPFIKEEKEKLLNDFENTVHPRLLELIRCEWLHPPSARTLTLRHPERKDFSQANQSQLLDDLMGKRSGRKSLFFQKKILIFMLSSILGIVKLDFPSCLC